MLSKYCKIAVIASLIIGAIYIISALWYATHYTGTFYVWVDIVEVIFLGAISLCLLCLINKGKQ